MIPKTRSPRTREERREALSLFLSQAPNYGVCEAWLIGSMVTGKDHPLSDVDLCIKGNYSLKELYALRDSIYLRTGVIIQLVQENARKPRRRAL